MASDSSFLSKTLQSITTTKLREQTKRRNTFETSKTKILESIAGETDQRKRLEKLLAAFSTLSFSNKGVSHVDQARKEALENVGRYVEQSHSDPSVSMSLLKNFDASFLEELDQESRRFEFADLYYRLLGEWTCADAQPIEELEVKEEKDLDGSFEHVPHYDLDKLRERFASVVFTPLETDEVEIDNYLGALFEDDYAQELLTQIRNANADFARDFKARTTPFDSWMLKQCIKALLNNNLLNDDAKSTLNEFSTNEVVLEEIADVLNLRFADLDDWSWLADEGMYYEPRRQLNGKYRIMMDMDILQAIFLHYIAVTWCTHIKTVFERLARDNKFWRVEGSMTDEEQQRHFFFTGERPSSTKGVRNRERDTFLDTLFMSAMPSDLTVGGDPYGEDRENEADESKTGLGMRQMFLRQLATDVLIRRSLYGDAGVIQSDLQWYATGLPHSTLFAVLRFWGVPDDWISLFRKYAEAPLRMTATPNENVRLRRRGIPITDAFETFFGETVLFCMDVAVNRLSSLTLVRFHDDLFLHGEPHQVVNGWETIKSFNKVLGLDINTSKTGSVYLCDHGRDEDLASKFPSGAVCMGMLQLTDSGEWEIDQKQVKAHARQLQKQLGQCRGIISWTQTWNACLGRFFQDTLGKPANCFGQKHVKEILDTHAAMQRRLFESNGGSVSRYLCAQIKVRFGVADVPDAFLFLSEDLGGLGVRNPFIPFFILKDQVMKIPGQRITRFRTEEKRAYKEANETFNSLTSKEKQRRLRHAFGEDSKYAAMLDERFFTFDEFTKYRMTYSCHLLSAFDELMLKPGVKDIHQRKDVQPWFTELDYTHNKNWHELTSEDKWKMHLYADELKERFGALSIVDKNLLPTGVMKMLKQKKVTWQLIIWE